MNIEEAKEISAAGWPDSQIMQRKYDAAQWLIMQNVRMFTAIQQIADHLKLPCDKRDDRILEQIVNEAMLIDSV